MSRLPFVWSRDRWAPCARGRTLCLAGFLLLGILGASAQTPTPTPTATVTPTFTPTFTPSPTDTPTHTPTPTPTFAASIGSSQILTDYVVESIPALQDVVGRVAINYAPAIANATLELELMLQADVGGATETYLTQRFVISTAFIPSGIPFAYNLVVPATVLLPLDTDFVLTATIDPDMVSGDLDPSDNTLSSAPGEIVHLSGKVFFDDCETTMTHLLAFTTLDSNSGIIMNGSGEFKSWPIHYGGIDVDREEAPNAGDLHVTAGNVPFTPDFPYDTGAWSYYFGSARLTPTGPEALVLVNMPKTVAYKSQADTRPEFFSTAWPLALAAPWPLSCDLIPEGTVSTSFQAIIAQEDLPFYLWTNEQEFSHGAGLVLVGATSEHIHQKRMLDPRSGLKPSNDLFYWGQGVLMARIGPDGLHTETDINPVGYYASFPAKMVLAATDGFAKTDNGIVDSGVSRMTAIVAGTFYYNDDCPPQIRQATTTAGFLNVPIMPDGGFLAEGTMNNTSYLDWNTYQTDVSSSPTTHLYIPGTRAFRHNAGVGTRVQDYLYAGRTGANGYVTPAQANAYFNQGAGKYAGFTFEAANLEGLPFTAEVAGQTMNFNYTLGSKLYVRTSGVTGKADAGLMLPPVAISIYGGYKVNIESFGQSFLSNDPDGYKTKINGEIDIPWPSDMLIGFSHMDMNGCGNFEEGDIDDDSVEQVLSYWDAPITIAALGFRLIDGAMSDDERTLWLSTVNPISTLSEKPKMEIEILPNGNVGDSHISNAFQAVMQDWPYHVTQIYLTSWDGNPTQPNGFYNVIGDIILPFWGATHSHGTVLGSVGTAKFTGGAAYFEGLDPDPARHGIPNSVLPGQPINNRINAYISDPNRFMVVEKTFADLIPLSYPVEYRQVPSNTFGSQSVEKQDLIVLDIESSVERITTEETEVRFGLRYEGLPQVSLTALFSDFSDELAGTFLAPVKERIDTLSEHLTGDLSQVLRPHVQALLLPAVQSFVDEVQTKVATVATADLPSFKTTDLPSIISAHPLQLASKFSGGTQPVQQLLEDQVVDQLDMLLSDVAGVDTADIETLVNVVQAVIEGLSIVGLVNPEVGGIIDDLKAAIPGNLSEALEVTGVGDKIGELEAEANSALGLNYVDDLFDPATLNSLQSNVENTIKSYISSLPKNQIQNLDAEDLTNQIINQMFNSALFVDLNQQTMALVAPVKNTMDDLVTGTLDSINQEIMNFLDEIDANINEAFGDLNGVAGVSAAEIKGYAIISYDYLEHLHIDASFTMKSPDEVTYHAYLDMLRQKAESDDTFCGVALDGQPVMDVTIGADGIGLSWGVSEIEVDIAINLMFLGSKLSNFGGSIQMVGGQLGFESFAIVPPTGFGVAVGIFENYLWAQASVRFDSYKLYGGLFLGKSCDLDPLLIIDPEVGSILQIDSMTGVYCYGQGSFPIYNAGCLFKVGVEVGAGGWYFTEGPSYGGKFVGGIYGQLACVVSAKGQLRLIGGKDQAGWFFSGNAWVAGGIGFCDPEDWDSLSEAFDDDWCLVCGANLKIYYRDGQPWDISYDVGCH